MSHVLSNKEYQEFVDDFVVHLKRRWDNMKKEIAKALKDLEDAYEAEPATGGGRLPEFDGAAKITSIEFEMSNSNKPMIVTTFNVVEPEKFEGREIKRFDMISKNHWPFFKGFAEQIGLELPSELDVEEIENAISEFNDNNDETFEISVTHDGDYNRIGIAGEGKGKGSDDDDDKKNKKKKKGDDDEDDEKKEALLKLIKKHKLGVDPDDFEDLEDLDEAVKKAAKKKGVKLGK